jgi:hypothetical protein
MQRVETDVIRIDSLAIEKSKSLSFSADDTVNLTYRFMYRRLSPKRTTDVLR